jgi:DNA-binding response OmpR family regulator
VPNFPDKQQTANRPLRVLVVDDDRDTVLSLTMLLNEEGHSVEAAHKGKEVLSSIRKFEPDVVLLDIGLPDMTGYDVARAVRRQGERRPTLIAVTAWNKETDRLMARAAGFDHYLAKPYDPRALLALLGPREEPSRRA